jgi:chromate transporter
MSFIFPAVLLTLAVAMLFEQVSDIDWVIPIINGIKAAVLSFILAAILKLGKKAVKSTQLAILGVLVLIAAAFGVNEILCILSAGMVMLVSAFYKNKLYSTVYCSI